MVLHRNHRPVPPILLRNTPSDGVEDATAMLLSAEYASIRAESLQSFVTSQSIIQWSLATYGVLFGAGLLAASSDVDSSLLPMVKWMAVVIYGLLLPGLVCAAAWSWIGEIRRMERTGVYLRGLERALRTQTSSGSFAVSSPLNWEGFLAGMSGGSSTAVKGLAPYVGTGLLFGGSFAAATVFFYIWIDRVLLDGASDGAAWTVVAVHNAFLVAFLAVSLSTGLSVITLGRQYFDFASGALRWIGKPIPSGRVRRVGLTMCFVLVGILMYLYLPASVLPWGLHLLS